MPDAYGCYPTAVAIATALLGQPRHLVRDVDQSIGRRRNQPAGVEERLKAQLWLLDRGIKVTAVWPPHSTDLPGSEDRAAFERLHTRFIAHERAGRYRERHERMGAALIRQATASGVLLGIAKSHPEMGHAMVAFDGSAQRVSVIDPALGNSERRSMEPAQLGRLMAATAEHLILSR